MKKLACILLVFCAASLSAQQYSSGYKAQNSLKPNLPDFSYYSKNYKSVFGTHQYTFDRDKLNKFSIYVAPDGNYYSLGDGRFVPSSPIAGITAVFANYTDSDIFSGVISALTGKDFSLNYTLWKTK